MLTRRSIYMISIQSEKCRSRQMHKDINNQIQKRIVYLVIFQINYARDFVYNFATISKISQMYRLFNLILIDQPTIKS